MVVSLKCSCFSNSIPQLSCLVVNFISTIRFVLFFQSAFSRQTEKSKGHENKTKKTCPSRFTFRIKSPLTRVNFGYYMIKSFNDLFNFS